MSHRKPELPRLLDGFSPHSQNPNIQNGKEFSAVIDFEPGETYWQIDTKHPAVAAAVDKVILGMPIESEVRGSREQKRINRIAEYLLTQKMASTMLGGRSELAIFVERDITENGVSPGVLLYTRGHRGKEQFGETQHVSDPEALLV